MDTEERAKYSEAHYTAERLSIKMSNTLLTADFRTQNICHEEKRVQQQLIASTPGENLGIGWRGKYGT